MAPLRIDATALFELLDALPHAVWVEDDAGRIVHRNALARRRGALDTSGAPVHLVPVRVRDGRREVELRLAFASLSAERLDADLLRLLCSASSQDLRNIRQVVAMVRDALEGPDGGTASLPLAISALERTLEWGQDLLSVLRVVAPGIRRGGVVDALRVFRAASTLGRTMTEGIPQVRIDVDGSGAWVRADARLLARTFLELVLAACDSARAAGAQALSVRALLEDPGHLRIDVRRDGGTVPDDPLVAAADRMREGGPLRIPGTVVALERSGAGAEVVLRLVFPLGSARDRPPATVAFVGPVALRRDLEGALPPSAARIVGLRSPYEGGPAPDVLVWAPAGSSAQEGVELAAAAVAWCLRAGTEVLLVAEGAWQLPPEARVLERVGARVLPAGEVPSLLAERFGPVAGDAPVPRIHEAS